MAARSYTYSEATSMIGDLEDRIDDAEDESDDETASELRSELESIVTIAQRIYEKYTRQFDLLRLLKAIDEREEDVPIEFVNRLERMMKEFGWNPKVAEIIINDRHRRDKAIEAAQQSINLFLNTQVDPSDKAEEATLNWAKELIDSGIERRLIQDPVDSELIDFLKQSPQLVNPLSQELGLASDKFIDTVDQLIENINRPKNIASIGARLGDYEIVHRGIEAGALNYGLIITQLLKASKSYYGSPLYLLNGQDRAILVEELENIILEDQETGDTNDKIKDKVDENGDKIRHIYTYNAKYGEWLHLIKYKLADDDQDKDY